MDEIKLFDVNSYLITYKFDPKNNVSITNGVNKELFNIESSIKEELDQIEQQNIEDIAIDLDEEKDNVPAWVKRNCTLGALGESISEQYLKTCYSKVENVSDNHRLGYDIKLDDGKEVVEVKTSAYKIGFHITLNELKKANKYRENYHLFFVHLHIERQVVIGYLIKDMLNTLDFDIEKYVHFSDLINLTLIPNKFYIKLKPSFLNGQKEIDLKKFLR